MKFNTLLFSIFLLASTGYMQGMELMVAASKINWKPVYRTMLKNKKTILAVAAMTWWFFSRGTKPDEQKDNHLKKLSSGQGSQMKKLSSGQGSQSPFSPKNFPATKAKVAEWYRVYGHMQVND